MAGTSEKFVVFRAADAVDFDSSGAMSPPVPGSFDPEAVSVLLEAGIAAGADHELVFSGGGMSLARIWFKSGYPLPRHSHDCACLYYILGGSLMLGTERLGPGDGFFVDAEVPYAYTAGEAGVELLEFRARTHFGIQLLGMNSAWAQRAAAKVRERSPAWAEEQRPSARD